MEAIKDIMHMIQTNSGTSHSNFTEEDIEEFRKRIQLEDKQYISNEIKPLLDSRGKIAFERNSIFSDSSIMECGFDTYRTYNNETEYNLQTTKTHLEAFLKGEVYNLFLSGKCGSGKSHLAISLLKELNAQQKDCLFITVSALIRKVKSTWADKDSKLTEQDLIERLIEVEYLVIDDLGAELGSVGTEKKASDFINRLLFDVFDGRQHKTTIITTNLTGKSINEKYDVRIVSRMLKNVKALTFKESKDYRLKDLAF